MEQPPKAENFREVVRIGLCQMMDVLSDHTLAVLLVGGTVVLVGCTFCLSAGTVVIQMTSGK